MGHSLTLELEPTVFSILVLPNRVRVFEVKKGHTLIESN